MQDLGLGLDADEWDGIVEMVQEELTSEDCTLEESVINASLNSIQGPQKENILHLFKALALLPEDSRCPLPIIAMMFESVAKADAQVMKRCFVASTFRTKRRPLICYFRRLVYLPQLPCRRRQLSL